MVLQGWVPSPGGAPLGVVARKSGSTVASTWADLPRNDVPGAKGFSLALPAGATLQDILEERITVSLEGAPAPVQLYDKLAERLRGELAQERLAAAPLPAEISSFALAVGLTSPDGVVSVGRNGHLFLASGSNGVRQQYLMDPLIADGLARRWHELIAERHAGVRALGARLLQLIVPEKSTLLPELCPFPASGDGTPLLRALEARLEGLPCFINGRTVLGGEHRFQAFRQVNSHLSVTGTLVLLRACLERLRLPVPEDVDMSGSALGGSDMSARLSLNFYERLAMPAGPALDAYGHQLRTVEFHEVERHVGTRVRFANPGAPHKLRVLAFANSFFERGHLPTCLSWWFARWFEHFSFVWSPELDYDMVRKERPDVVVCQTIERFLPVVPSDLAPTVSS